MEGLLASAVVAAVVSGGVTLLTPWAQWRSERSRLVVQHRRESIQEWRGGLQAWEADNGGPVSISPASFIKEAWYFSLRPHLTEGERRLFEGMANAVRVEAGGRGQPLNLHTRALLDAIDRIERGWKLV